MSSVNGFITFLFPSILLGGLSNKSNGSVAEPFEAFFSILHVPFITRVAVSKWQEVFLLAIGSRVILITVLSRAKLSLPDYP